MIVIDTSALIDSLSGPRSSASALLRAIESGERILLSALVLYEWRRGPRVPAEIEAQEALFPSAAAIAFGHEEAALSAELCRTLRKPRGREIDLAIAATAMVRQASLWTLNVSDFADIRGLRLMPPR